MKRPIIQLTKNSFCKSLVLLEDEFWFSSKRQTDIIKFQEIIAQKSNRWMQWHARIPYTDIQFIKIHEDSPRFKLRYVRQWKQKEQKEDLDFECNTIAEALRLGNLIGSHTLLKKERKRENSFNMLWQDAFVAFVTGMTTVLIAVNEPENVTSASTGKGKAFRLFLEYLHSKIGAIGIFLIGGAITFYLIYRIVKRYQNPKYEIVFQ